MSLEPLQITAGRRFASVFAGFTQLGTLMGGAIIALSLPTLTEAPGQALTAVFLVMFEVAVLVPAVLLGQIFVRAALGKYRTRGSVAHYSRIQGAVFGVGLAVGTGLSAFAHSAQTLTKVALVALAVVILGLSVMLPLASRRRELAAPPHPDISLVPGRVVDHWLPIHSSRMGAMELSVISYPDEQGNERFVRHLYQQSFTVLGVVGQMQVHRRRPNRPRFVPPKRTAKQLKLREIRDIMRAQQEAEQREK